MGALSTALSIVQNLVQTDATLRDYEHARKIFTPNNSSLLPKTKNWFHIYFQLDPDALASVNSSLSQAVSNNRIHWDPTRLPVLGILAKNVKLPNFQFEVKKSNQYNRWSLTPTKINYQPIAIDFWDDTIDLIRSFWYAYYQYMIQDPNYVNWQASQQQGINIPNTWTPSTGNVSALYTNSDNWGGNYGMDTTNSNSSGTGLSRIAPFFRSVRVYQFNRSLDPPNQSGAQDKGVQWTEYVLVNPIISAFDHDTVDFATSEFMSHRMSVEYETVLYNSGLIYDDEIASWDAVLQTFFDTTPSPNGGINNKLNNLLQTGAQITNFNNQVRQIAANPSGSSVATVLASVGAATVAVNDAAVTAGSSKIISVPTVVPGFGVGGLPPPQAPPAAGSGN